MKNILIVIAFAAIIIAILPALRRDKPASEPAQAPDQTPSQAASPAPSPVPLGSSLDRPDPSAKFHSSLGSHHGGLGAVSMTQGPEGSVKVYSVKSLLRDATDYNGQIVQLRFSRPLIHVLASENGVQPIEFSDRDAPGSVVINFPPEGAARLDLLSGRSQPGLSFYIALEKTGIRAVGREWRSDKRAYIW